jgi:ArsR family transcriptional regulator, arsenate/arsenite/antimonite-responsive transcriptional repressor
MSMDRASDRLVRVAKALGDPTRLELLRRISAAGEICCKDLVTLFPVSQATVSHHLKILTAAGLVSARREGQFGYYSLRGSALEDHAALLGRTFRARPGRRAK